jgi:hypothetical protein
MPARSLIAGSLHRPSPAGHAIQGTNIPIINCGLGEPASLKTAGMSGVWFQGVLGRWIPFPAAFFPCGSAYVVSGGLRGPAGAFFLRRRGRSIEVSYSFKQELEGMSGQLRRNVLVACVGSVFLFRGFMA